MDTDEIGGIGAAALETEMLCDRCDKPGVVLVSACCAMTTGEEAAATGCAGGAGAARAALAGCCCCCCCPPVLMSSAMRVSSEAKSSQMCDKERSLEMSRGWNGRLHVGHELYVLK